MCAKTHQVAPTPENGTRIYAFVNVKLNLAQLESNGISQPADVSAKIYYHAAVLLSFGIQQHVHVTVLKHVSIQRSWIQMPVLAFVQLVSLARQERSEMSTHALVNVRILWPANILSNGILQPANVSVQQPVNVNPLPSGMHQFATATVLPSNAIHLNTGTKIVAHANVWLLGNAMLLSFGMPVSANATVEYHSRANMDRCGMDRIASVSARMC